jgi:small nuclear ribonucleoprotein (snRNP)-like protein
MSVNTNHDQDSVLLRAQGDRNALITDSTGRVRPRHSFRASTLLEHDMAEKIFDDIMALAELVAERKKQYFQWLEAYEADMNALYGATRSVGGRRGGKTLENIARTKKVTVSVRDYKRVDGSIIAAQNLVNEVLTDMLENLEPWVRNLLNDLFVRDEKTGALSTDRLQTARQVEIPHPKWDAARNAIADSIRVVESRPAINAYPASEPGKYEHCLETNFSRL